MAQHTITDFDCQNSLGEKQELQRRAAGWHEQNGLAAEAVPYALAAQDWERAARLIEQVAQSFLSRGEAATLRHWLSALPVELVSARPRLCIAQAWTLVINLETAAAETCLQQAERSLGESERDELISEIMALRSFAAAFSGDFRRAAELARQVSDRSPQDNPFLRSMSALDLGIAHIMDGNAAAACEAFAQATQLAEQARHFLVATMARCQWAEQYIYLGQLGRAAEVYEQALEFELDERLLPMLGMAYNGLGEVHRTQNQLDEAVQLLEQGIPLCQQWEEIAAMDGYVSLARTRQAQGDERAANEIMQKASQLARKSDFSVMDDLLVGTHQVRLWVAQGHLDEADRWAQEFSPLLDGEGQATLPYAVIELMNLALTRLWLAQGQSALAQDVSERQTRAAEQRGRMGVVIEWLAPCVAYVASLGRGYLPPMAWIFFTLASAQLLAIMGWGEWYPWAVPALVGEMAGPKGGSIGVHSLLMVLAAFVAGLAATFAWWRSADQTR